MRLRADFWVSAYIRRCAVDGVHAVLRRRGAAEAGAIFVKVDRLDGTAILYGPAPQSLVEDGRGDRLFVAMTPPEATPLDAEDRLSKEISFDPDLWVVEVEDRQGRAFLDLARKD